jgi:hypothetical protein
MADADLRDLLSTLTPTAREALRRVLIRDQPDRDAIASTLLHYGERNGMEWADVIDMLTMHPDARRRPFASGRASATSGGGKDRRRRYCR